MSAWATLPLGQVVTFQRGYDLPHRARKRGEIPIVSSAGVTDFHDVAMVDHPGVVTGRYGTIGEIFLISEPFWPLNTTLYVRDFHGNDPRFIYYLLQRFDFASFSGKSGVPGVNRNDLHVETVTLPTNLSEQRAIAAALSDADALIESLEQLLAKKRDLKQAAMQQLLTGQTRLPGFHGEWQMKRLGDAVDTDPENPGPDTRDDFAFKYIALEDVERGILRSHSEQVFAHAPSRARRKLRPSDILVSTVRPNLQSHLLFRGYDGDWVCSTGFCVVRCREAIAHPPFVFSQMFTDGVTRQIDALLTGSNYPAINRGDVRSLTIPFPNLDEQTAIADVLSDMDAELAALEARRDKTRDLKQAMMQELLTGKTRLVAVGCAHA